MTTIEHQNQLDSSRRQSSQYPSSCRQQAQNSSARGAKSPHVAKSLKLSAASPFSPLESSNFVQALVLHHYRNYEQAHLEFSQGPVVLYGPNGAGKTNLLEALSLLATGTGFRSAKLQDFIPQVAHPKVSPPQDSKLQNSGPSSPPPQGWSAHDLGTQKEASSQSLRNSASLRSSCENRENENLEHVNLEDASPPGSAELVPPVVPHPSPHWVSQLAPHWAVHVTLGDGVTLATGLTNSSGRMRRLCKIKGEPVKGAAQFHDYLHILHITPEMDHLFMAPSSDRRRFVDNLIATYDPAHKVNVSLYEKATRQRLALLRKEDKPQDAWLTSLEKIMADQNIKIAKARGRLMQKLKVGEQFHVPLFPKFDTKMTGVVEDWLAQHPEDALERLCDTLKKNRPLDAAANMTFLGVHRSDLAITHQKHQRAAADCSTGEQKILLLSLLLAFIHQRPPEQPFLLLLLDDVIARLDFQTRMVLFEQVEHLNLPTEKGGFVQTFFSGTDEDVFAPLKAAQFFEVNHGSVIRRR